VPTPIRAAILAEAESAHVENYVRAAAVATGVERVGMVDPAGAWLALGNQLAPGRFEGFRSAPELLARGRPDLAIVTYAADRAPAAIATALEAGCHVLAEKPACTRPADFARLARTADAKHRHLLLALANRAHPLVRQARELVRQGALGRPYAAHLHLIADQTRLRDPAYAKSWFASRSRAFGGFLAWLSIHYVDLLPFLTGSRYQEASAMIRKANRMPFDVEDSVAATFAMEDGLIASLHGGYYLDRGYQAALLLWGSGGWLRLALHGATRRVLEWRRYQGDGPTESAELDGPDAYALLVQAEVDAIARNTPPPASAGECLHLLETLAAAYRAATEGKTQRI